MLTIVIPWCNRDTLAKAMRANEHVFRKVQPYVVVVNCGGDNEMLKCMMPVSPAYRLAIVTVARDAFNKAVANNIGVRFAERKYVLFLDADIVVTERCVRSLIQQLDHNTFVTISHVKESSRARGYSSRSKLLTLQHYIEASIGRRSISLELSKVDFRNGSRSGPGLVLVRRSDFIRVGGMNGDLTGWGWEDADLLFRLQSSGLARRCTGTVLHLSHEVTEGNLASQARNQAHCIANYCLGHLQGTYSRDVRTRALLIRLTR
jgi:glycosyltransferase involved in cell wall biosynthesis